MTTTALPQRQMASRRLRRRTNAANAYLFCSTNGCPSFLELDPATGLATCPICGLVRRVS
jgi:hypothetical protein